MSTVPNPPLPDVKCGLCGSDIYLVDIDPAPTAAGDMIGAVHESDQRPLAVQEWVCGQGHRVGVRMDMGELDLGIVLVEDRDSNQVTFYEETWSRLVCEDGHPLNDAGRDPRQPDNPWPNIRPATDVD